MEVSRALMYEAVCTGPGINQGEDRLLGLLQLGPLHLAPLDVHAVDAARGRPLTKIALRGRTCAALEARAFRLVPAQTDRQRPFGEAGFGPA